MTGSGRRSDLSNSFLTKNSKMYLIGEKYSIHLVQIIIVEELVVNPENNKNGKKNNGESSNASVLFAMIVPSIKPNIEALVVIKIDPRTN